MAGTETAITSATPANGASKVVGRDALLAGLNDFEKANKPADAPPKDDAAVAVEPEKPEDKAAVVEDDIATDDAAEVVDADTQKRLDAVAKSEVRSKAAIAKERASFDEARRAFERDRNEFEAKSKAHTDGLKQLETLASKVKTDPWALLEKLGVTADDADYISRVIYAHSKTAAADPKNREAVEAAKRSRESESRVERIERELQETRQQLASERQSQSAAHAANQFLDGVAKAVGDDQPLAKSLLAKNPSKAREQFGAIAYELANTSGEVPEASEVLAEYEKRRRAELEELGIDPASVGKTAANGTATRPAKTLGGLGGATPAKKPAGWSNDELKRALETDKLE